MFLRLDDDKVRGFLSNYGYIDVRDFPAEKIADFILKRLEHCKNGSMKSGISEPRG
jgi:hypothetical protein